MDEKLMNQFDKLIPLITAVIAVVGTAVMFLIVQSEMLKMLCQFIVGGLMLFGLAYIIGCGVLSLQDRYGRIQAQLIHQGTVRQTDVHSAPIRLTERPETLSLPDTQNPEFVYSEVDLPDLKEQYPDLMKLFSGLDRILIVAPQDSGKTTLLENLLYQDRAKGGKSFVIDSHAEAGQWPDFVQVVGAGMKFDRITALIKNVHREMFRRYEQRSQTSGIKFPRINLYIDELSALTANCEVDDEMYALLTQCRKINIRLFGFGQSENAADVGCKGHAEAKGGYEAIVKLIKDENGERYALVRMGEDKLNRHAKGVRYALPGPVTVIKKGVTGVSRDRVTAVTDDEKVSHRAGHEGHGDGHGYDSEGHGNDEGHEDDDCGDTEMTVEDKIRILHSKGLSVSEICLLVWKVRSSKRYQKIRNVIAEMNEVRTVD